MPKGRRAEARSEAQGSASWDKTARLAAVSPSHLWPALGLSPQRPAASARALLTGTHAHPFREGEGSVS